MTKTKDRLIIDTNLWISFLLSNDFKRLDDLFADAGCMLIFSEELLDEFIEVARRPKFEKYFTLVDLQKLIRQISFHSEFIKVSSEVNFCRDPKDNFLLSLALDGEATHLITGDKDLLELKKFEKTEILTISAYLLSR